MAKLTDKELALLLNCIATMGQTLHHQSKGQFPSSSKFDSYESAREFALAVEGDTVLLTFPQLNDLFSKITKLAYGVELSDEDQDLLNLPDTGIVH